MRYRAAWTLAELLIVLAILALLASILMPSLAAAKRRARLAVCASNLHQIHHALLTYSLRHNKHLPPFAFSNHAGDLPLSGQWGGASRPGDPDVFGRRGVGCVNLWSLVREELLTPPVLVCAGADGGVLAGTAGAFPHTEQFSTYCLRFPTSPALFRTAPGLANYGDGTALGIYAQAAGGQEIRVGTHYEMVPLLRMDGVYPSAAGLVAGEFEPGRSVLVSDGFWRQRIRQTAPGTPGVGGWPVRDGWTHDGTFNTLTGCGAVWQVSDDGTIAANSLPLGGSLPDDGLHYATYAERVWAYFDATR